MDENNNPIQEPGVQNPQNNGGKKQSAVCIVSFVFALIGLLIAALPCGLVALITGIIGVAKFDPTQNSGKGLAIAGIVVGAIDIIAGILNIVFQLVA